MIATFRVAYEGQHKHGVWKRRWTYY